MLELLKEKILNYSYDLTVQYMNSIIPVDPISITPSHPFSAWNMPEKPFGFTLWLLTFHNRQKNYYPIYEKLADGYLIYTGSTAVLFANDNRIYKLSCTHLEYDWMLHTELYNLAKDSIDIEIPIMAQKLELLGNTYWYTVVERPNMFILVNPHQIHQENRLRIDYVMKFIEQVGKKVRFVKQIHDKHQLGCLANGSPIHKFETDPNDSSKGIWVDLKRWNISFDMYLAETYGSIYHYLDDHRNRDLIKHEEVRPALNYLLSNLTGLGVSNDKIMLVETALDKIVICDQGAKPKNIYL